MKSTKALKSIQAMTQIAICTALICICAWITIPLFGVPFTLQTFAICLAIFLIGPNKGAIAVGLYLIIGAIGMPVFSGFSGGIGVLVQSTGGYLIGFLMIPFCAGILSHLKLPYLGGATIGVLCCYLLGSLWFDYCTLGRIAVADLPHILSICVVPFLLPDAVKICLAYVLAKRLRQILHWNLPS